MQEKCCGNGTKLIYACSGASDVGKLSDEVSRRLAKNNYGKMTSLAAVGAHLSGFVESAKGAKENISIDGCSIACSRKVLEHIGINPKSYILTDMGYEKGKTSVSDKIIKEVINKVLVEKSNKVIKKNNNKKNKC